MAITINPGVASVNPGAAARLLASAADGGLQLLRLGLGVDPDANNRFTIVDGGQIGQAAGPLIEFDDTNNYLEITGCNVGIGTTGPSDILHILKNSNDNVGTVLENQTSGASAMIRHRIKNDVGQANELGIYSSGTSAYGAITSGNAYLYTSTTGLGIMADNVSGVIKFATGGNGEKVRIDSSGNVGIGTTSPDRLLHAEASTALTDTVQQIVRLSHITSGTPANGIGAGLEFEVETSNGNNEVGATIEAITTDVTATSEDFDLSFKLMAAGAAAAEKFKIASDGGIFAPALLQQTAVGLAVEYDTVSGEIYAETSALRFKQHVQPLELDTAGIFGLTPKRWTDRLSGREEFGLIAEEVAELVPGLAVYGSDGPVGVKYHKLAVLMLEELRRLRQEVDQLREAA